MGAGEAWAVIEIARRKGDFALVGVALRARLDGAGTLQNAGIVMFGMGGKPQRMEHGRSALERTPHRPGALKRAEQSRRRRT
jgi:CO/xanthine dehydrogenase FAD-binding subunit